jgi:hypothetical protein
VVEIDPRRRWRKLLEDEAVRDPGGLDRPPHRAGQPGLGPDWAPFSLVGLLSLLDAYFLGSHFG